MFLNKNFDGNERNDISWQILGSFMEHRKHRELINYLVYCLLSRFTKKTLGNNLRSEETMILKKYVHTLAPLKPKQDLCANHKE